MEKWLRKRTLALKTMEHILAYSLALSNEESTATAEDCVARLEKLEVVYNAVMNAEEELSQYQDVPSVLESFEKDYYKTRSLLKQRLNILQSSNDTQSIDLNKTIEDFLCVQKTFYEGKSDQIKLPKLNIEPFSGDSFQWPTFHDFYTTTIHENNSISPVRKLQILHNLLSGEAKDYIKNIPFTSRGYDEAWQCLVGRYDDKPSITTELISKYVTLKPVVNGTVQEIRKINEVAGQVLRGLRIMGEECESRDPWLIFLLMSKLDHQTRLDWANHSVKINFPKIEDLLNFLNQKCRSLERSVTPSTSRNPKIISKTFVTHDSTETNVNKEQCLHCNQNHFLGKCPLFRNLDINTRRERVVQYRVCFNCLRKGHSQNQCKFRPSCQICGRKHHTLLHLLNADISHSGSTHLESQNSKSSQISSILTANSDEPNTIDNIVNVSCEGAATSMLINTKHTLLPTALVYAKGQFGEIVPVRILLDSGSQSSFITEACTQRLGLPRSYNCMEVKGLGTTTVGKTKGKVVVALYDRQPTFVIEIEALIISKITSNVPGTSIFSSALNFTKDLYLADPNFCNPGEIDILVGCDVFFQLLCNERIMKPHNIIAHNSKFGWLIIGSVNTVGGTQSLGLCTSITPPIDEILKMFWELEEIPKQREFTEEEINCEKFYQNTTTRDETGRFIVRLPFKKEKIQKLGGNFLSATNRLHSIEKRLSKSKVLQDEYSAFMNEYINLNHMQAITQETQAYELNSYYLPHHCVLKNLSTTTRLRVVFDGSAKTLSGISLNESLMVGPNIQNEIHSILLRFRRHRIAVTADIEKMYRQILVHDNDQNYQRILWRSNPRDKIEKYKLNTVTYGTSCAPFLAIRTLKEIGNLIKPGEPLISNIIQNDFYVDDLLTGADSLDSATVIKAKLEHHLLEYGFNLRKWRSNEKTLTQSIKFNTSHPQEIKSTLQGEKVLGMLWDSETDCFMFQRNEDSEQLVTKRIILRKTAQIFDPLGLLAPIVLKLKLIFQKLWLQHLDWDELVPESIAIDWKNTFKGLETLNNIRIPRYINFQSNSCANEIHAFSDASEAAYGCTIYFRSISLDKRITCRLITAKSRVSPIKQVSLPRLELCAAVLLCKLVEYTVKSLGIQITDIRAWTDSKIVLHWLSDIPRKWKCFVGNRTSQILESIPRCKWSYVPSKQNPADLVSRGVSCSYLQQSQLYWEGPEFLKSPERLWPKDSVIYNHQGNIDELEERSTDIMVFLESSPPDNTIINLLNKWSSWFKIKKIVVFVLRFSKRFRQKHSKHNKSTITAAELNEAEITIIRVIQKTSFASELSTISNGNSLSIKHHLSSLDPFIDSEGILRVGGRLSSSQLSYCTKHPIILPKNHPANELIIRETHITNIHAGNSLVLSIVRQKYWMVGARNSIKKHLKNCVTCIRFRSIKNNQKMGELPPARCTVNRPFLKVGLDYAGPILIKTHKRKNAPSEKAYIAVFVCLCIKAVHLEVVSSLSTESFLAALKRFTSRRGIPEEIWCDNGSNFIGANRELRELKQKFIEQQTNTLISDFLLQKSITFHFIPPRAPNFGGLWEAAVKSFKYHFKRVISIHFTFEELTTVTTQIEGLLNSRPLCRIDDDPTHLELLTPGHFLIGVPLMSIPEPSLMELPMNKLCRWQTAQKQVQQFFKRWSSDYLCSLQQRFKWKGSSEQLKVDDVVLIKEDNQNSMQWLLGRVLQIHPGADGIVRVVTLKTQAQKEVKRPVNKLIKLPIQK